MMCYINSEKIVKQQKKHEQKVHALVYQIILCKFNRPISNNSAGRNEPWKAEGATVKLVISNSTPSPRETFSENVQCKIFMVLHITRFTCLFIGTVSQVNNYPNRVEIYFTRIS